MLRDIYVWGDRWGHPQQLGETNKMTSIVANERGRVNSPKLAEIKASEYLMSDGVGLRT